MYVNSHVYKTIFLKNHQLHLWKMLDFSLFFKTAKLKKGI